MPEWKIQKQDLLSFVEIGLRNEGVRCEAGALHYCQGPIETKTPPPGGGGLLAPKRKGGKVHRPVYHGTGQLMLEPSFHDFFALELEDEAFILDSGTHWASDLEVEVTTKATNLPTGLFGKQGLTQTLARGTGTVILRAPGPVTRIDLRSDRLVVEGNIAVARSAELKMSVQVSARGLFDTRIPSEMNVLEGTGTIYLAPIPNQMLSMKETIAREVVHQLRIYLEKSKN